MRELIYFTDIKGHNLEYAHHLHEICEQNACNEYIFVFPFEYETIKERFSWKTRGNITYYILDELIVNKYRHASNFVSYSLNICKLLTKLIKRFNPDKVFVPTIIEVTPLLPFLVKRDIQVEGILYRLYFYENNKNTLFRKFADYLKFQILVKSPIFTKIYILNDRSSTKSLNERYNCKKFSFLPDPFIPIVPNKNVDIYETFNINKDKQIILHMGAMNRTKGTIDCLKAIACLQDISQKYVFVFAGKIGEDIREEFYQLFNQLKLSFDIVVIDEFCEYSLLGSLCEKSSLILIPYKRTSQSSGIIGYAAQFGVPVLAPSTGLLGDLVKKYKLGLLMRTDGFEGIKLGILDFNQKEVEKPSNQYCSENTIDEFKKALIGSFN